jgi:hypothetical protein
LWYRISKNNRLHFVGLNIVCSDLHALGDEKNLLPLPRTKTQILGGPAINLITILTARSHIQSVIEIAYFVPQI